ncbi:NUDIX domain-containing protein [Demequina sp. NBRC 110051]|uniref:NUDIX domain-containing protein n=1 Tax=Demequina sp. NBRC 110051 TaxID=1570340 RepID=UPI00352B8375
MTEDKGPRGHGAHEHSDVPVVTSRSVRAPRLPGMRDAGDAWVAAPDGTRYWGRFGAAGLLVHDPDRGVLLQHRATWSHYGDTWGIPGGALHAGESAFDGACREAAEEGDVPRAAVEPIASVVLDRRVWRYTTVVARAIARFEAHALDAESHELRWVPVSEVAALPLHPGFCAAWALHRRLLTTNRLLVVDAANVVGARADGWWKDRAGATSRLLDDVDRLASLGLDAGAWRDVESSGGAGAEPASAGGDLDVTLMPRVAVVVEGQARDVGVSVADTPSPRPAPAHGRVQVVRAQASGDDALVEVVSSATGGTATREERGAAAGDAAAVDVVVVTSDRELQGRVRDEGARAVGAGWLLRMIDGATGPTAEY